MNVNGGKAEGGGGGVVCDEDAKEVQMFEGCRKKKEAGGRCRRRDNEPYSNVHALTKKSDSGRDKGRRSHPRLHWLMHSGGGQK